ETKIRSTKNVSIDPSPRYFGEHDKMTGEKSPILTSMTSPQNSCFNQIQDVKGNYVRRIASSDSIPYALSKRENYTRDYQTIDETCCVRRVNSPDVRQLRYIQSAKGAWSYNL
ncbi:GSCOCG00007152001-RA-CDS, partial [Cotesia congregata]